jgi:hypothetical protein
MRFDVTLNRHQGFGTAIPAIRLIRFQYGHFNMENTGWEIVGKNRELKDGGVAAERQNGAHIVRNLLIQHMLHLPTDDTPNQKGAKYKGADYRSSACPTRSPQ